jgi:hypothetical protein
MYSGEWTRGKIQGKGTMHYPDGSMFEGDFKNDKPDGIGTFR